MQNGKQYVKWQCISVFKLTFSHTCVQYLVQKEDSIYNLHLPFPTLVLIANKKHILMLISCKIKMKMYYTN